VSSLVFLEHLSGATYRKLPFGPVPKKLDSIINLMTKDRELQRVKTEYHNLKMNSIQEIKDIEDFVLLKEDVYYIRGGIVTKRNLNTNRESSFEIGEFDAMYIDIVDQLIVLRDSRNFFRLYQDQNFEEVENPIMNYRLSKIQSGLGVIYDRQLDPRPYGLFDFQLFKTKFLSSRFITTQVGQHYSYYLGNNKFKIYENTSGEEKHFSKIEIDKFNRGFVYPLNNKEFIFKFDKSIHRYNLDKGLTKSWSKYESKYRRNQTNGKISYESETMDRIHTYLDGHKIVILDYNVYSEIDLKTDEIKTKSLFSNFQENGISGIWSKFNLENGIAYCISDQSGDWIENNNHLIFKLDLNDFEIKDKWQLPKKGKQRRGMNINGFESNKDYIGVMEQNKTLHIIEKKVDNTRR